MISKISLVMLISATLALSACRIEELEGGNSRSNNDPDPPAGSTRLRRLAVLHPRSSSRASPTSSRRLRRTLMETNWSSRSGASRPGRRSTRRPDASPARRTCRTWAISPISVFRCPTGRQLPTSRTSTSQSARSPWVRQRYPGARPRRIPTDRRLTDLAGYRIYYGRSATQLNQSVVLNNPGLTRYVVENLSPAQWHFAMSSVNASGAESRRSQTVSKTIT